MCPYDMDAQTNPPLSQIKNLQMDGHTDKGKPQCHPTPC